MRRLFRTGQYRELIAALENIQTEQEQMPPYLSRLFERAKKAVERAPNQTPSPVKEIFVQNTAISNTNEKTSFFSSVLQKFSTPSKGKAIETSVEILKKRAALDEEEKRLSLLEKSGSILEQPQDIVEKKEELQKSAHELEMQLASNIQKNLLPQVRSDALSGLEIGVQTINCSELSGDVYDFLRTKEDTSYFYLGDATGHGTGAGLIMTMVSALMPSVIERVQEGGAKIISLLNSELKPRFSANMFITLVLFSWHQRLKKLAFTGAGHEHILIYRKGEKTVEKIITGGIAVGMLSDISKVVREQEISLSDGDIVMVFTDGITEAKNGENEKDIFGLDRLMQLFLEYAKENFPAKLIAERVIETVRAFQGKKSLTDDMTIIVVKRKIMHKEEEEIISYQQKILEGDLKIERAELELKKDSISPEYSNQEEKMIKKTLQYVKILIHAHDYESAKAEIKTVLRVQPDHEEAMKLFEEINILMYEYENNLSGFSKTLYRWKQKFSSPEQHIAYNKSELLSAKEREARNAFRRGEIESVQEILAQIQQIEPKSTFVERMLARLSRSQYKTDNTNSISAQLAALSNTFQQSDILTTLLKNATLLNQASSLQQQNQAPFIAAPSQYQTTTTTPAPNSLGSVPLGISAKNGFSLTGMPIIAPIKPIPSNIPAFDLFAQNSKSSEKPIMPNSVFPEKSISKTESEPEVDIFWEKRRKQKKTLKFMQFLSPMSKKDFLFFVQRLATFLDSGIPPLQSLEIIQDQTKHDAFISILQEMIDGLQRGKMMSETMSEHPKVFQELYISLFRAGERSGALAKVLKSLGEQLAEQDALMRRLKSAMIYPVFVIIMSITMMGSILTFIVPKLTKVYSDTGVPLPKVTQLVVGASDFLRAQYISVILGAIFVFLGAYLFSKTKTGERILDWIALRMPIFGTVVKKKNIVLFTGNLAMLLEHGIHMNEALKISANITTNLYYQEEILQIHSEMVRRGVMLSEGMGFKKGMMIRKNICFPMELAQTAEVGERTGNISHVLKKFAQNTGEDLRNLIKGMADLFEPFMLVFVGLSVGTILAAVMMPLMNIGSVLRKQ